MNVVKLMPQSTGYKWYVKLSAAQDSDQGRIVGDLYYANSSLLSLVGQRTGYPHNGGEHSLVVAEWEAKDLVAGLDLVIECYSVRMPDCVYTIKELREKVVHELAQQYRVEVGHE